MPNPQFMKTTIILPVSDIYATIAWYERVLGFQTRYVHGKGRRGEEPNYANYLIMHRDAVEVHFILDESDPPGSGSTGPGRGWTRPGNGYLGLTVTDVDAVYAHVQGSGATITSPLRKENWPARGFGMLDPDGNAIHVEQPV